MEPCDDTQCRVAEIAALQARLAEVEAERDEHKDTSAMRYGMLLKARERTEAAEARIAAAYEKWKASEDVGADRARRLAAVEALEGVTHTDWGGARVVTVAEVRAALRGEGDR